MRRLVAIVVCVTLALPAGAQLPPQDAQLADHGLPPGLQSVAFEQRLDAQVPLDATFVDSSGKTVRFGDLLGDKPIVLALAYYTCPMLCHQVLNGAASALAVLDFDIGDEFHVVTLSFDARDTPESAAVAKKRYLHRYGREEAAGGWHFLSGDEAEIRKITDAVGFSFKWDSELDQYAHASGLVVLTPDGRVARYLYGIEYSPKDLRLSLVEASAGKIGSPVDQLLLFCYQYDPATGKYGAVVMNMLRIAALLTLGGLIAMMLLMGRRRRLGPRPVESSGGSARA